jgi:hypothetical protein
VWPPGPVTRTLILSQAAVIGPVLVPILPTSSLGSQCSARGHDVEGSPGDLLGRLEDQADAARQGSGRRLPGQEQAGSEQHRGVHVVAACMTGVRDGGPVGHVLLVVDRQRVQVGPQCHQRAPGRFVTDVHDQPGPLGHDDRPQPCRGEPERHPARGPVLVVSQFRVRVQVPAERDQFVLARGEELVEFLRQVMPEHGRPP